jgi:hypothetical protein
MLDFGNLRVLAPGGADASQLEDGFARATRELKEELPKPQGATLRQKAMIWAGI